MLPTKIENTHTSTNLPALHTPSLSSSPNPIIPQASPGPNFIRALVPPKPVTAKPRPVRCLIVSSLRSLDAWRPRAPPESAIAPAQLANRQTLITACVIRPHCSRAAPCEA